MTTATPEPEDDGFVIANHELPEYVYRLCMQILDRIKDGSIRPDEVNPHIALAAEIHNHYLRGGTVMSMNSGRYLLLPPLAPTR